MPRMRCASSQDLSSFAVAPTAVVRAVRLGWYVVQRLSLWQSHLSELTAEHREAEKLRQDHGTQHVWNENRWRKKFERIGHRPLGVDFPQPLLGSLCCTYFGWLFTAWPCIGVMPTPLEDTSSLRSKLVNSEAEASERARRQELMCLLCVKG